MQENDDNGDSGNNTPTCDQKLLLEIARPEFLEKLNFTLIINNKIIPLNQVIIKRSSTPLANKRAGTNNDITNSSENYCFKISGKTNDFSIIPLLSKTMLGPNTEFGKLEIKTKTRISKKPKDVTLITNLTNTVQSSSDLQLNMVIIKTISK